MLPFGLWPWCPVCCLCQHCVWLVHLFTSVHKHNYVDHAGKAWRLGTEELAEGPSCQLQKLPQEDARCKQKSNNTNQEATQKMCSSSMVFGLQFPKGHRYEWVCNVWFWVAKYTGTLILYSNLPHRRVWVSTHMLVELSTHSSLSKCVCVRCWDPC